MHRYRIKYRKKDRKRSEFVLSVHEGFELIQKLDVEEAIVATKTPLSKKSHKSLKETFIIKKIKGDKE